MELSDTAAGGTTGLVRPRIARGAADRRIEAIAIDAAIDGNLVLAADERAPLASARKRPAVR